MLKVETAIFADNLTNACRAACRQIPDSDAEVVRIVEDGKVIFETRLDEHGWTVVTPLKIDPP